MGCAKLRGPGSAVQHAMSACETGLPKPRHEARHGAVGNTAGPPLSRVSQQHPPAVEPVSHLSQPPNQLWFTPLAQLPSIGKRVRPCPLQTTQSRPSGDASGLR
jgi:hypothetical protein